MLTSQSSADSSWSMWCTPVCVCVCVRACMRPHVHVRLTDVQIFSPTYKFRGHCTVYAGNLEPESVVLGMRY